jgi:phosphohistidine phosphatase
VRFVPALYGASAQELVELLRTLPDDVGAVLLIGHNPGVTELLTQLAGDPGHVPTGTFATLRLRGSWAHLDRRTAVLEDLVRPRTLTGEDDAEQ